MNIHLDLFLTFARVGACTFGGGYAMLPILQREITERRTWADAGELADYFAVGQCTPGIIAVNTATFVGHKLAGVPGGIAATLGLVFPSVVIIGLLATVLDRFAHIPAVAHAFSGVRACVCALILSSVIKLLKTTVTDFATAVLFLLVLVLSVAGGFVPAVSAVFTPVVLVVLAGLCGLLIRTVGRCRAP